jgi:replication factor A2
MSSLASFRVNTYVRVLGTVKAFQSKRSVSAGHIRPVDSFNEVLYHKMEAVWVHLQITKGTGQVSPRQKIGSANPRGPCS